MEKSLLEDRIFKKLKFTKKWIQLGIVDSDSFIKLKKRYLKGEDTSDEHYRWAAFTNFVENKKNLPQQLLYEIYDLGKNDPNPAMGRSMKFRIIALDNCPEDLIDLAIQDEYKGLSKHALKIKEKRNEKKI